MERILVQDHNDNKGYSAVLFETDEQLIDAAIEKLGFSYREYRSEDLEFIDNEDIERLLKYNKIVVEVAVENSCNYYVESDDCAGVNFTRSCSDRAVKYNIIHELPTKTEAALIAFEDIEDDYTILTISEAVQFIKDHHADMHIDTYKAITKILKPKLKYKLESEETVMIENTGHDKPLVWIARDDQHIIDTAFESAELVFNEYTKKDIDDDTCPHFADMLEEHGHIIQSGVRGDTQYHSLDNAPSKLQAALDAIESHVLNLYTLTMTEAQLLIDGDESQYTGRHQVEVTEAIKNLIDV